MSKIKVVRFEKEGQSIWEKVMEAGGTIFSGAIQVAKNVLNPETLFVSEEKFMLWIKANNADLLEETIKSVLAKVNAGMLVPYRMFSETPTHDKHEMDTNPNTGESMNRYSVTRIGTPKVALENHRQYMEVSLEEVVTEKAPVEKAEKVTTEA